VLGFVQRRPVKGWLSQRTLKLVDERKKLKVNQRENAENAKHYNFLCRDIVEVLRTRRLPSFGHISNMDCN